MATLVDLTDQELAEIKAFTKQTDPGAALRSAMAEYLRHARRMELKTLSGRVEMDDNWQSLEALELGKPDGDARSGPH